MRQWLLSSPPPWEHCAEPGPRSSPRYLASGSGDTTVRFWDLSTETPQFTAKGGCGGVLGRQLLIPSLMDPLHAQGDEQQSLGAT